MAITLSDVLQRAFTELGQMEVTLATGGSTTTAIDTKLSDIYGDDDLIDGVVVVIRDAAGANAAPEKEYARIASYVASTNTITVDTALSAAIASGDTIGIIKGVYPLRTMVELVNNALSSLGDLELVDKATLTPVSAQSEYTWEIAWKRRPPLRIDYQTGSVSTDNRWRTIESFDIEPAVAGSTGKILFYGDLPVDKLVRVWYEAPHPRVSIFSSVIDERIHPELIAAVVVEKALEWQNTRTNGTDNFLLQRWNDAKQRAAEMRSMHPIWRPDRRNHKALPFGNLRNDTNYGNY